MRNTHALAIISRLTQQGVVNKRIDQIMRMTAHNHIVIIALCRQSSIHIIAHMRKQDQDIALLA